MQFTEAIYGSNSLPQFTAAMSLPQHLLKQHRHHVFTGLTGVPFHAVARSFFVIAFPSVGTFHVAQIARTSLAIMGGPRFVVGVVAGKTAFHGHKGKGRGGRRRHRPSIVQGSGGRQINDHHHTAHLEGHDGRNQFRERHHPTRASATDYDGGDGHRGAKGLSIVPQTLAILIVAQCQWIVATGTSFVLASIAKPFAQLCFTIAVPNAPGRITHTPMNHVGIPRGGGFVAFVFGGVTHERDGVGGGGGFLHAEASSMAVAIVEAGGFFTGGTVVPFKTFANAIVSVADAGVAAFGQRVPHVGPCRDIRPTGGWLVVVVVVLLVVVVLVVVIERF